MVLQFTNRTQALSTAVFEGKTIEVRRVGTGRWSVYINDMKTNLCEFPTREKAVRRVQQIMEKVIANRMKTAVANQGRLSPKQ